MTPEPTPINPPHYRNHSSGVECIQITEHMTFNLGNVIKYLWRNGLKDGTPALQDLQKAQRYLSREIERVKAKQPEKHSTPDKPIESEADKDTLLDEKNSFTPWGGGRCPVDPDTTVEVKTRWSRYSNSPTDLGRAGSLIWDHGSSPAGWDIVAYRVIKPEPETFEVHGHTWFKHTPGDPMPCKPDDVVDVLWRKEMPPGLLVPGASHNGSKASRWNWECQPGCEIHETIGWRYADKPSTTEQP